MSIEILMGIAFPLLIGLVGAAMIMTAKNLGVIVGGGLLLIAIVWLLNSLKADESAAYVFAAGAIALLFGLLGLSSVIKALKVMGVLKIIAGGLMVLLALVAGVYFFNNNGMALTFGLFGSEKNALYAAAIITILLATFGILTMLGKRNLSGFITAVALLALAFTTGNYFLNNGGRSLLDDIYDSVGSINLIEIVKDGIRTLEEILGSTDSG